MENDRRHVPITPEMLAIMQVLCERINSARANMDAAAQAFNVAVGQLDTYICQCAVLLGIPKDTPFDKPKAVFMLLEDKET